MNTITLKEIKNGQSESYTIKDTSPRGCATVSKEQIKAGDKVVIDSEFVEVIEDEEEKTVEEATQDILNYFESDLTRFAEILDELDGYDGYLSDDRSYPMYELEELHQGLSLHEFLDRLSGGFSINEDFFYYDGWGELCSESEDDRDGRYWDGYGNKWTVDKIDRNRYDLWEVEHNPELCELLDKLEEAQQREDEQKQNASAAEEETSEDNNNYEDYEDEDEEKPSAVTCVKIMPGQPAELCQLVPRLKDLQNAVSDHGEPSLIEYSYPLADTACMVLGNEEAKLINMKPNRIICNELYCGPIYIVKDDGNGSLTDLSEEEKARFLEMFKDPTPPSDEAVGHYMNSKFYDLFY